MSTTTQHEIEPAIYHRRWAILAVLCTSLMIVIIGNTSLNVAIPTLARDLKASDSQLQWMIDAYSLIFAGLLFSAGTIGDRFGRKGTLQAGLAVFLLGAVVATTATTASATPRRIQRAASPIAWVPAAAVSVPDPGAVVLVLGSKQV